ncbi:Universal stress protein family domain protein [Rasamsonia emersonii CBS 393.64]|uniref:Universal stress protein family domain protein n=1 Tax=Rasamsonia emersonii (strain ATCC 16479 / CBS 393.64 / IMI 116815) TaxID=1408163 RepID=A0A0F4YPH9_RASE3|nr:Universal stress protein family domain protein [Rasamsonia emersonii CBS 393.64]KKA20015.1 Universal stress protein family domain protein [Rasamsonia emersonii CBS 393.64]
MAHNNSARRQPLRMSVEQALEEERREILELLEGPQGRNAPPERRASPAPVRSLLDTSLEPAHRRYGSIAGIGVGVTPSSAASSVPATDNTPDPGSQDNGPDSELSDRPSSDGATTLPPPERRRALKSRSVDIHADYRFSMRPTVPHIVLPKHTVQAVRSLSPRPSQLNKYVTGTGKVINMDRAYKKLSDAALATSSGSLSSLSKNDAARESGGSGESLADDANVRLPKDSTESAENSECVDTSEDEVDDTSSEDEALSSKSSPEKPRGRQKSTDPVSSPTQGDWSGKKGPPPPPTSPSRAGPLSLLAELEEERELLAPPRRRGSVLTPAKDKPNWRRKGVHPNTSFDHTASMVNTPVGSDDEADLSDIRQAQNLSIYMSSVDNSIPDRAIRTIIRGDFPRFQREAAEGLRRQRKYLVATDLSDESVYALEWTIGTILRDGDTLFAVYAIADESAGGVDINSVQIGEGAKVMQDTADVVGKQTEKTALRFQANAASLIPHALASYFGSDSRSNSRNNSVDARALSRAEAERARAIEGISQTCVRLLRKTMLQVRVAVEVIHCKSPKHLLTEAIDGLEPTLVILGSRGRSALKVTKSSVPVMVARKKLKKHIKKTRVRLSNNLTTPKSLAMAKID